MGIQVTDGTVSSSLSRDEVLKNNAHNYSRGANDTGYFKVEYDHKHIYYVCNPGDQIDRSKLTKDWYTKVIKDQFTRRTRSSEARSGTVAMSVADTIAVSGQDRRKLRKTSRADQPQVAIDERRQQTYFDSPEAEILFKPTEDETVLEALDRRIELFQGVHERVDGWQNMVAGDSDYE